MEQSREMENGELNLEQQHPWPGLRAFSEADASFFFGREQEVTDITRMIRQETITVLFGKSGLGKSSILQAGVSPQLRKDAFLPIYIRLNHHENALPLEDQVEVFMEEAIKVNNLDAPQPIREETLWEYFHKKPNDWWDPDNQLLKPVLIFDQFEEILTIGQENPARAKRCLSFLTELEDLIENRPPTALVTRFKQERGLARDYDFERNDYRVLISLREDYLADLEGLRERLRSIMNNRYRLLPMTGEQAINVILKPGAHLVKPAVADEIIDFIGLAQGNRTAEEDRFSARKKIIEPTLLSVILRELNCHRINAGEDKISSALVAAKRPEHILLEFYESAVKGLPTKVHRFIEEQLITASGSRNRVAEEDAIARFEISHDDISTLINRRIIQRDKMAQVTWLELSHDTLTPVVFSHAERHFRSRKLRRFMLQASAIVLLITGIVIGGIYNQARERELQVAEASKVALDLATELESNSDMTIASKQLMMSRLQENFEDLRHFAQDSRLLKWRYVHFLAKRASVQFAGGYIQLAIDDVRAAEALVASDKISLDDERFLNIKVQLLLVTAIAEHYQSNPEAVHSNLDQALVITSAKRQSEGNSTLSHFNHRLNRLRVQTLIDQGNVSEASRILDKVEVEIKRNLIDQANDLSDDSKRFLYIELFKLSSEKSRLISYGFYKREELYDTLQSILEDSKKLFKNHNHQIWQGSYGNSFLIKSAVLKQKNKTTEARAALDTGIELLADRVRNNNDNLRYRYDLGSALIERVNFAETNDFAQAKLDIRTARSLAFTIRRDSNHPYLAHYLASNTDLSDLRTQVYQTKGDLSSSFERYMARQESYEHQFSSSSSLDAHKLMAIYWKIRGHTKRVKSAKDTDDKQFNREVIVNSINSSMFLLDALHQKVDDRNYLANRRFWIYEGILRSSDPGLVGDEKWLEYALDADRQLDVILATAPYKGVWGGVKSWTLAILGNYYANKKNDQESARYYGKLVKFALERTKNNMQNMQLSLNTIWGIRELIKTQRKMLNWQRAVEVSELLFELTDANNLLISSRFAESKLRHWKDLKKELERIDKELNRELTALEKTNRNESQGELSQLRVSAEKLNRVIKMSNIVIEQLSAVDKDTKVSSSTDSKGFFDIKSINIKTLVKKIDNKLYAKQPFGWKTAAIYEAPWSYTLIGKEVEIYSEKLNTQVVRVRVTELPFYEKGRFLTIENRDKLNKPQIRYYLESNDILLRLNGNSPAIHEANKKFPITLDTGAKAISYLRFFTTFVHGDEGAFSLVETNNQMSWQKGATLEVKNRVADLLRPIYVWQEEGSDDWYATASVQYSNAIFYAKFRIYKTGMMEMLGDKPVASDLPIAVFKLAEDSGRSEHFVKDLYLGVTEGININKRSDEINKLHKLLIASSKKNIRHRESILSDIIALSKNTYAKKEGKNFSAYQVIQTFLTKEPVDTHRENRIQAKDFLSQIIGNQLEVFNTKGELSKLKKQKHYLQLSFYQLFASDYEGVLESAKKGLKIDPEYLPLQTNHAHALLFLGRKEDAMAVYMKYRGKKIDGRLWETIILEDFDQLEKAGIRHEMIETLRKELGADKKKNNK